MLILKDWSVSPIAPTMLLSVFYVYPYSSLKVINITFLFLPLMQIFTLFCKEDVGDATQDEQIIQSMERGLRSLGISPRIAVWQD